MDKSQLELQISQLTELQNICNEILELENPTQNDTEIVKEIKKSYSLSKEDIDSIKSILMGKKKGESVSQKELDSLKKKCESYCVITEINLNSKDGSFIGYTKIKQKSSNLKNRLNKKLKEIEK